MKTKRKSNKVVIVIFIIVMLIGAGILLYPSIANMWNTHIQQERIAHYQEVTDELALSDDESLYQIELEKARAYNEALYPTPNPEAFTFLTGNDPEPDYLDCLNILGDGTMGYIEIPKLNISIPIYHGTDAETMLNGAGHLEGTSLPIGGESTHSVISAHRGLPGSVLFTDLDKLEIGDVFYIHILNETLCYRVEFTNVVEPDDVSDLVIQGGRDLCTLVTCTPYGVNTERLLVRGERIPIEEAPAAEDEPFVLTTQHALLLIALAVIVAAIIVIILFARRRRNKNKKEEQTEREEIQENNSEENNQDRIERHD